MSSSKLMRLRGNQQMMNTSNMANNTLFLDLSENIGTLQSVAIRCLTGNGVVATISAVIFFFSLFFPLFFHFFLRLDLFS